MTCHINLVGKSLGSGRCWGGEAGNHISPCMIVPSHSRVPIALGIRVTRISRNSLGEDLGAFSKRNVVQKVGGNCIVPYIVILLWVLTSSSSFPAISFIFPHRVSDLVLK